MSNANWKPVTDLGNGYMILRNGNTGEYNLASGYTADNTWAYGHYCNDLASCLVCYLRLIGDNRVKSKYQNTVECATEITFDRMTEIATTCLHMVADGGYTREDLFELDLTAKENDFFEMGFEEEEE
jgi:hypothetical protein